MSLNCLFRPNDPKQSATTGEVKMSGSSRFTIIIATAYYRCKPSRSC